MDENNPSIRAAPSAPGRRAFTGESPAQRAKLISNAARELGRSWNEVAPIYDQLYAQMARSAKVRDFLPVLVLKNLRAYFHRIAD